MSTALTDANGVLTNVGAVLQAALNLTNAPAPTDVVAHLGDLIKERAGKNSSGDSKKELEEAQGPLKSLERDRTDVKKKRKKKRGREK